MILLIFLTGFFLGLRHALDTDHLTAVSTIVSETKNLKKSSLIGLFWGAGHTTTLFLVGMIILIFNVTIPLSVSLFFELIVGVMLIALGLHAIRKIFKNKIHIHSHKNKNKEHFHLHSHKFSSGHSHSHKPFIIGAIHGLAGSAAIMLLVLTLSNSIIEGLIYILIFGLGSIIGMFLISGIISIPFLVAKKTLKIKNGLTLITGSFSIFFGGIIIFQQIFFIGG